MPEKIGLGITVLEAAQRRIVWVFDVFPRIYVSFSGGKDSTVMLHLVMDEAIRRGRKVGVLLVDLEGQYKLTIEHIRRCYDMYVDYIEPYWCCLPIALRNAVSVFEPKWCAWQPDREADWIRQPPPMAITDLKRFPFFRYNPERPMEFEEFVPAFGEWYAQDKLCASFVGIRTGESLNRWRTIAGHGTKFEGRNYCNHTLKSLWNVYPIYDWKETDIWAYHGKTHKPYNRLYDRMHQAGLTLHQMRICQPYGDDQRKGLWLFHLIEPETWARVVARVAGANQGALYAGESGNILGNQRLDKPIGRTWESFAHMLLNSMPPKMADHYKDKIAGFIRWYQLNGYPNGIPDEQDPRLEAMHKVPSWRRVCKTLLRNDYWGKHIGFEPQKGTAHLEYKKRMAQRRNAWNIFPTENR